MKIQKQEGDEHLKQCNWDELLQGCNNYLKFQTHNPHTSLIIWFISL